MEAVMREGIEPTDALVKSATHDPSGVSLKCSEESSAPTRDADSVRPALSLRQILAPCRFFAGDDVIFESVATSSASAERGQLIVYRIGQDCPTQLIADAMARGAAGILTEQLLPCPLPQCVVGDIELAMAQITAHVLNHPDRELLNVAVVGSAGKTSTTLLIASLLRAAGIRTAYECDLGTSDGLVQSTSNAKLLAGSELVQWISEAVDCQCKAGIIEIDEERARQGHYDAIEFDMVVVTGSAGYQGDFGPSGLQCVLDRLTQDGVVIAPIDDPKAMQVVRESGLRSVTYGVRRDADVTAKIIEQTDGLTTLLISHQDTTAVMETTLCGSGMAANHAAATLIGLLLAQPLQDSVERLSLLRVIPGRGQRVSSHGFATVVLESGGAPDRIATSLRTHRSMKGAGRLWCIAAIDQQTGAEQLAELGSHLERFTDHAIVTSTLAGKREFLKCSHQVLDGVQKCAALRLVADRQRAIEWAVKEAGPQDTIVVFINERNQTAQQHRTDLETILHSIDQVRIAQKKHPINSVGAGKIHLSIFR
jgi:UDP-N-acetylmuramoyl-L-alanyl-D-glutamate--2,6-diaminopimelate ligase